MTSLKFAFTVCEARTETASLYPASHTSFCLISCLLPTFDTGGEVKKGAHCELEFI